VVDDEANNGVKSFAYLWIARLTSVIWTKALSLVGRIDRSEARTLTMGTGFALRKHV
jgi:hypothetical protein